MDNASVGSCRYRFAMIYVENMHGSYVYSFFVAFYMM